MSASPATTPCDNCGSPLPAAARFCPECGRRVEAATAVEAVPPADEGEPVVRVFGTPPRTPLLVLSLALIVAALVLFAAGAWIPATAALVVGAALGAALATVAGRRGETRGTTRLSAFRDRSRAAVEQLAVQTQLRRELLRLRHELERLSGERGGRLRALGEAVYGDDEAGIARERAALADVDRRIEAKEEQMAEVAQRAQERVAGARLESQSTVLLEPTRPEPEPYPPATPEPYPPPDEGTPPLPEPVPEPYPPPDEADPPRLP